MLLPLLVIAQLSGVEGRASKFVCPAYPRLYEGLHIHGLPLITDTRRRMVIRRGATELKDGDVYEMGELLFVTLNDTSGDANIVFETNCSSCTFIFGICPNKYRSIGSIASMNMPTDYTNFTVWGAYSTTSGQIRIAPPISLTPRVPDPTMAPTFAVAPTISPTRISAQRYAVMFDVEFEGLLRPAILNNTELFSHVICQHMQFEDARCKVIASVNSGSRQDAVQALSLWGTIADIVSHGFGISERKLLVEARSIATILVDNFEFPEWQKPAIISISQFIDDASESGYTSQLKLHSEMNDLVSTSVLNARLVNNSDTSLYQHSCSLDGSLTLYWSLDTAVPSRYVRGMLQISGRHWVSGGTVLDGVLTMVHDPENVVFLYNAETDKSWVYSLSSYLAKKFKPISQEREFTRIVTVSKDGGMTSLQFEQQQNTGISTDPILNLEDPMGSNGFIWAYGDRFQQGHSAKSRGITKVMWRQGTCSAVETKEDMFPYLILAYGCATLFAVTVFVTQSPWRHSKFCHFMKFNRVQWMTTKINNKCRKYDDKRVIRDEIKAVPKRQWIYNEILSTSIGGFLFTVILSGLVLSGGYFIYRDRLTNFKLDPLRCYSIALAYMGLVSLGISMLTSTKTELWQFLFNVSIDRTMKYHKYASVSAVVFLMGHTGLQIWFWGVPLMINLDYTLVVGRARPFFGFLSICCFMLVFVTSLPVFRNRYYHRFLGIHSWFFPGVILSILHYIDFGLLVLGPGLLLYVVDLFLRHLHSWLEPKVVARRLIGFEYIEMDVQFHNIYFFYAKNAVRLKNVSTQFINPSQWYYVCVPEIKSNEWHPLTVVGFSGNKIKFVVRRRNDGGWTENLYTRIFAELPVSVRMRGPYGSMQLDLYNPKYKELFFIAGGVGAAVVQSMIEALVFYYTNYDTENGFSPSIKLVIVSQNRSLFEFMNKRLEFYATLKKPKIALDLYWTSKYMKYLQQEEKYDPLPAIENQLSSKPSENPFEIVTETYVKNPEESSINSAPADGYVSESYKTLSQSPVSKAKPAGDVTPMLTPQATSKNSKEAKAQAISPQYERHETHSQKDKQSDSIPKSNVESGEQGTSEKQRLSKSSSKKSKGKQHEEDDDFRLQTQSIDSVTFTPKRPMPTGKEIKSTLSNKGGSRKDENDDDEIRIRAEPAAIPNTDKSTSRSKRSRKSTPKKTDDEDDSFQLNAGDSIDEFAKVKITPSPSKKSKRSKQDNRVNVVTDLNTDSVFSAVYEPVGESNSPNKKRETTISKKGSKAEELFDTEANDVGVTGEEQLHIKTRSSRKNEPERLFTPSKRSPTLHDQDDTEFLPSTENLAAVHPSPDVVTRASSKHITFGPVPEPPKSRIEDFIVYEHFYENILKRGRPNIEDIILNGINGEFSSGARSQFVIDTKDEDGVFSNQAVIVCAPPAVIASTRAVCSMYNIDMHDQAFDYN